MAPKAPKKPQKPKIGGRIADIAQDVQVNKTKTANKNADEADKLQRQ